MALTRRRFLALGSSSLLLATATGCGSNRSNARPAEDAYTELFRTEQPNAKGTVLVLMPDTAQTKEVWTGLSDELRRAYDLIAVRVDARTEVDTVARAIARHSPQAVVLMNNPTVAAYAAYQRWTSQGLAFPPAIVVMSSILDEQVQVQRATGIAYEVPLITVVTNLRRLIATPITRVGVVRRGQFRGFVERQAKLAATERIVVEQEEVGSSPNASELKRALRRVRQRSDVLWVLNDDHLLSPRLIVDAWLPGVSERPWIPTIVGAAPLVSPRESFGTFAVLPDHTALGVQTASLLFDLADNGWSLERDGKMQLPLSTTTTIDLTQAAERFNLRDGALAHVDRILK
jgi:hypothetical protein